MILSRMRFASEPGVSTRKIPLRVRCTGRFDAPSDKARKRHFLGRFDASRTETRRCVLGHRKREKTATPTVGDKSSPDAHSRAWGRAHETRIHGIPWISRISRISRMRQRIPVPRGHPRPPGTSPSPGDIPKISPEPRTRKPARLLGFPKISPISPKSPRLLGCRGFGFLTHIYISKVKFNVSLCICKYASAPPHPRHPGDIGDIGDISRKPLKMQGFLNARAGDISGDIFLDGDIPGGYFLGRGFPRARYPACALHRSIRWHRRERPKLPL